MTALLAEFEGSYDICGVISNNGNIYPLGSDTKVLSTVFELFSRPLIKKYADENGYILTEPEKQNHYPDFTLHKVGEEYKKIAIDVKTTYINKENARFCFTLGGYTSFIRNNTKNIVFPFDHYSEHWVLGYVYTRVAVKKSASHKIYTQSDLDKIPLPYSNVRTFFQEKWKIAGDIAGSGNTTNIGSIKSNIEGFREGKTPFKTEDEFLDYWINYERTKALRGEKYSNIQQYRNWKLEQNRSSN